MGHRPCNSLMVTALILFATSALAQDAAPADRTEPLPTELEGVGITEQLDSQIPLELEFVDDQGEPVKLGDYFADGKPVILTLNYYRCPLLCGLQLNGLVDGLKQLDWLPGENFHIVTISFDPLETTALAKLKKQNYIQFYGEPKAAIGWHFLTGKAEPIKQILESTGFGIKWNEDRGEWMHAAALMVYTPQGRLSRYLYGFPLDPKTLRLSLVEASEGKIGTTVDQILLYCYYYDPKTGGYQASAFRVMQLGGGLTLLIVGLFLLGLWRWELRRRSAPAPAEA